MSTSVESPVAVSSPESEPTRRISGKGLLLAVCCVAQFMVILDLSIVNVALPSIQESLRFSSADLQWVIDAYAIVFAGFLMLAGRGADIFGQRRTFVAALLLFSLASLSGGLAPTSGVLIVARAIQGLGGAAMAASSLAIITSSFEAGPARHRAIALWGAMNGAGGAAGTLAGGVITQEWSWRWVLLINVPIGIAAAIVATRVVAERRNPDRPGVDLVGALVLTIGLLISAYGGVTAGSQGWGSPEALVPIAIGAILLTLFPEIEKRTKAPLIPPKAFTRPLRVVNAIVLLFSAALFPMWYMGSLYLQQVLALSPLTTGLVFLPMALAIFACASQAGKLVGRAGVRNVLGGGLLLMTAAMLLFTRIGDGGSAIQYILLPGILMAIGIGFSIVPSTIAATQSAGQGQAGLASGLVNTSRQVGGGLGLAVLISIATLYTSHLVGRGHPVPQALTDGFRLGYLIGAGLVGVAALLTFLLVPKAENPVQIKAGRKILTAAVGVIVIFCVIEFAIPRSHAAPIGNYTTNGAYTYVSEPGLHPPKMQLESVAPGALPLPGYVMVTNFYDITKAPMVGQSGPMILDGHMHPVWFEPVPKDVVASNLQAQVYNGKPVLSWWQGNVTATGQINSGEYVIVNQHYQRIATLKGTNGWIPTLHTLQIKGGDAWVTANRNVSANLAKYGGVNDGTLVESAVQEYDIKTGKLLYTWNASGHIPLSASYTQPPPNGFPWDAFHINSISLNNNGTFVVSMRNTWGAYLVKIANGNIIWTLGGKNSSFALPANAKFEWQHDVEMHGPTDVTLFDDHCCEITGAGQFLSATGPSRGLEVKLNPAGDTATVVRQYSHGTTFESQYMGNVQRLPNGNVFVGWGQVPFMSEFSKSGKLLFDAAFPAPDMSYRAYVQPWVGLPLQAPKGAARSEAGKTTVYASWNGATRLAGWKVLASNGNGTMAVVAHGARSGFETPISVPSGYKRFEVQALDAAGKVIATSKSFGPTA